MKQFWSWIMNRKESWDEKVVDRVYKKLIKINKIRLEQNSWYKIYKERKEKEVEKSTSK